MAYPSRANHIGIVACSAEGAALCYKTICNEASRYLGQHAHPEVSLHTHSLADYVTCLNRGDISGVGELMLSSAAKLAAGGADFLICPDNTIHQAMNYVEPRSSLPWLHIGRVVAAAAHADGRKRVGLTGTHWLLESEVYASELEDVGIECVRPDPLERGRLGEIIMNELVMGVRRSESLAYVQQVIARLKDAGCDAVILGCTEIPLMICDDNSPLPTLDSTRLLARAALLRALESQSQHAQVQAAKTS